MSQRIPLALRRITAVLAGFLLALAIGVFSPSILELRRAVLEAAASLFSFR